MSGSTLQERRGLGLLGRVAAAFKDFGPRPQVVGHVVGGLARVVQVFLAVGVDEQVDGGVAAPVHLHRLPSRRRLMVAHTPMTGSAPSTSLGTSRAMESTLLSAKSSWPVQTNPCRAPSTSAKNGSLRSPAHSRMGPAWTGRGVASKLTGRESVRHFAGRLGLLGQLAGGVPGRPGLGAVLEGGEGEGEGDVGLRVAVGVDVDAVDGVGLELRAGGGRRYGAGRWSGWSR